jgi:DNA-binding XRE family transcriptional regulator
MPAPQFKNYLRTYRKKLGLSQRQAAVIVGLKSAATLCEMERGDFMPSTRDCIAFGVLYKRSFRELWPTVNCEIEAQIDQRIRLLIDRLQQNIPTSGQKRRTADELIKKLQVVVDGLPEDIANVI